MAANKELQKVSLSFKLENGVDDEGNTLYKTKSFANLKGSATPDAVYAVAEGIKTVLRNTTVAYYINETSLLQNQ
ncbi:Protein of uncharacterised function (DUF1659) [uncultured Clostridium sp.]|uniref:DUF1659 domain-containing protein n=1 Tax=uncultured Clostridium sp. TaxID=59620 RepID=UPI000821FDDB|nr:DUF1659 domain-containing protein [uncultured Clostridium sp.]SCJ37674.1 Protein of uncharacterised function (DUF1659) [uncultured Clostridium sp.]